MGKKKSGAAKSAADTSESSGFALILDDELYDPSGKLRHKNAVIDGCRRVFEKTLAGPRSGLGFNPQAVAGGRVAYYLSGPGVVQAEAGDRPYKVYPLDKVNAIDDTPQFWVTCTLHFRSEQTKARLVDVSLVFFQGSVTAPKQPILRAEWDCISLFSDTDHAQPHWHVYQTQSTQPDLGIGEPDEIGTLRTLDDVGEPRGQHSNTNIGGANFHLAMASRWHESGPQAHRIPLTVDGVMGWVEGCIEYTRSQLTQS